MGKRRQPTVVGFDLEELHEAEALIKPHALPPADLRLIKSLARTLTASGVVTPAGEAEAAAFSLTEVQNSLQEVAGYSVDAANRQDAHGREVLRLLQERERVVGEGTANPALDGIDDYGRQVYEVYEEPEAASHHRTAPEPVMGRPLAHSVVEVGLQLPPKVTPVQASEEATPTTPRERVKPLQDPEERRRYERMLAQLALPVSYAD